MASPDQLVTVMFSHADIGTVGFKTHLEPFKGLFEHTTGVVAQIDLTEMDPECCIATKELEALANNYKNPVFYKPEFKLKFQGKVYPCYNFDNPKAPLTRYMICCQILI